jgi:integrase
LALTKKGRYPDGGQLYVQVGRAGGKSWSFRYGGHWVGLGKVDIGHLADSMAGARATAKKYREMIAAGQDPLTAKREAKAAQVPAQSLMTFKEVATAYLAVHSGRWKNKKHKDQWTTTLTKYAYPAIGSLPVQDIDVEHVRSVLGDIWGRIPETADRTRGRVAKVLHHASTLKLRSSENPFRRDTVKEILGRDRPRVKHHAALPWQKLPDLMAKLEKRTDVPALCLQWIILTVPRSIEARGAERTEVDRDKRTWTIPAERMKRKIQHTVPLSLAALDVLDKLPKDGAYLFPGQTEGYISDTALRDVLRELGITAEMASVHGMRSSFRDWAAEHEVDDPVAEACLAHAVDSKVVRAYKRTAFLQLRTDVMEKWGLYLT